MSRLVRLTRIHQQQLRRVELAELAHAGALAERARAERAVAAAEQVWNELAEATCHASVRALEEGRERLAQSHRELRAREADLRRWEIECATKQGIVRECTVEAKKLETLCEATATAERQEAAKIEQRGFDELAARRARR